MSRARFASAIASRQTVQSRSDRAQSAGNGFPPITHRQRVIGPPFRGGPFCRGAQRPHFGHRPKANAVVRAAPTTDKCAAAFLAHGRRTQWPVAASRPELVRAQQQPKIEAWRHSNAHRSLLPRSLDEVTQSAEDPFAALLMRCSVNTIPGTSARRSTCDRGSSRATPQAKYKAACGDKPIGPGARSMCWPSRRPYRRQGVGSRLLARAEEIARSRGCVRDSSRHHEFPGTGFLSHATATANSAASDGYPPGAHADTGS